MDSKIRKMARIGKVLNTLTGGMVYSISCGAPKNRTEIMLDENYFFQNLKITK